MERHPSIAMALTCIALLGACSHATSSPAATASANSFASSTPTSATPVGRAFGDTSAFGARIVKFEPTRHTATVQIAKSAYLVMLEVSPGKSIELITPTPSSPPVMTTGGMHQVDTYIRDDSTAARSTAAYQTCYESGMRALTPKPTPRPRPVKRDSTGRTGPPEKERIDQQTEPSSQALRQLENQCRSRAMSTERVAAARRNDERYLLMLSTDSPISGLQILARLNTLTVTASDIPSTMEAIAAGLFADHKQTWSGYYVSH